MTATAPSRLPLFGVGILDLSMAQALDLLDDVLAQARPTPTTVFFVNAHTLELASEDNTYRDVLASADYVFGDGTGIRWAIRMIHGLQLQDNVNGTDLVPKLLGRPSTPRRGYYLLGATAEAIVPAAATARELFPDWELRGFHDGYVDIDDCEDVIADINASQADVLLVGMGNPKQERWIHANRERLSVRICAGVGGLFDYWAGDLDRAPRWMRRLGIEWLHLMLRQPRKVRRYLVGGPIFLLRVRRRQHAALADLK